jgi:hypothetical protein
MLAWGGEIGNWAGMPAFYFPNPRLESSIFARKYSFRYAGERQNALVIVGSNFLKIPNRPL